MSPSTNIAVRAPIAVMIAAPRVSGRTLNGRGRKRREPRVAPTRRGVHVDEGSGRDRHAAQLDVLDIDEQGTAPATVVGVGTVPIDNYDGYAYFGSPSTVARYGDYFSAVTAGDGDYWIAGEYTPNIDRTFLSSAAGSATVGGRCAALA
jgi:hypothetical protein